MTRRKPPVRLIGALACALTLAACNGGDRTSAAGTSGAPGNIGTANTMGGVAPVDTAERVDSMTILLTSSAFAAGARIPVKYTCEGANQSPPLAWENVPPGARSLALILDDPDAPSGTFVHWVLWNIPPAESGLAEGASRVALPAGAREGVNGTNRSGYTGPCPPPGHGRHRYNFALYALDTALDLADGATKERLLDAMRGHMIGEGRFQGIYSRE